jgi:hypothetical protein
VCIATFSSVANADTFIEVRNTERAVGKNMLLINPGDLFNGVLSVEYERAIGRYFGLTAGLSVSTFRGVFSAPSDPTYTAISPEFGARVHFIRDSPRGLWFGPSISAGYLAARSGGGLSRAWAWGIGAALGYNFMIGRIFTFQLGAGGGFVDYGDRLVWAPRLKLGVGAIF